MHGFMKQVANGWTIAPLLTIETGFPFSVYDCTNAATDCMYAVNANGGIPRGGPATLAFSGNGPDNYIYTPFFNGTTPLFDSSYVNATTGVSDFGPYPAAMNARNAFRSPGYWNVDMGIYKAFDLTERFKLQFRAEMYNAFNHANLYLQSGDVDVSSYTFVDAAKGLTVSGGKDYRTVQLALRLMF
jgi:hypothetical protein